MDMMRGFTDDPVKDFEAYDAEQERKYQETVGRHEVTVNVKVYLSYDDCSPAEAICFANDYIQQALMKADDYDAEIAEVE